MPSVEGVSLLPGLQRVKDVDMSQDTGNNEVEAGEIAQQ